MRTARCCGPGAMAGTAFGRNAFGFWRPSVTMTWSREQQRGKCWPRRMTKPTPAIQTPCTAMTLAERLLLEGCGQTVVRRAATRTQCAGERAAELHCAAARLFRGA